MCVLLTKSAGAFLLQLGFYQLTLTWAWQFKPHTAHFNSDQETERKAYQLIAQYKPSTNYKYEKRDVPSSRRDLMSTASSFVGKKD